MEYLLFLLFDTLTVSFIAILIVWAFHLLSKPEKPIVLMRSDAKFWHRVLPNLEILQQPYKPPLVWGRSGHVQSFVYAIYGRYNPPLPSGERHSVVLK